jgi:hypothetical protein
MAFLDASVIIDYLDGVEPVVEYVDGQQQLLTSSLCVYEVLEGEIRSSGGTDLYGARQAFGAVRAVGFDEDLALEAARMQDELESRGSRMPVYDLLIAASARSTGDTLAVSDGDFDATALDGMVDVHRL